MTTEKMTLTQALATLKVIDKRTQFEIDHGLYCGTKKHADTVFNGMPVEDAKKAMLATYDKVTSLINRRHAIKKALTQANAETKITVAGKTMTIAEAIYLKSAIRINKEFLKAMVTSYNLSVAAAHNNNDIALSNACDKYIQSLFGNTTDTTNNSSAVIAEARAKFIESQTSEVFSGFPIADVIEQMKDSIDAFEADVDAAITVANSTTTITIEY